MPRRVRSRSRSGTRISVRCRSRSRDRTNHRHRHQGHRDTISRSASRGLYDQPEEPVQAIKKLVTSHQEIILDLLSEHRAEEKIQLKSRRFSSKQIEKQYQINTEFRELVAKITASLHASEVGRAEDVLQQLSAKLEDHEHDLIVTDNSPHGWLAVAKLRSNTELPKSLRKKLAQVEKDLAHRRPPHQSQQYGGARKKFEQFPRDGQNFSRRRPDQRLSPEEALSNASKQLRQGTCTHCHKGLHFYRECPEFWSKVQESREAKAKSGAAGD